MIAAHLLPLARPDVPAALLDHDTIDQRHASLDRPALPLMIDFRAHPPVRVQVTQQAGAVCAALRESGLPVCFVVDEGERLVGLLSRQVAGHLGRGMDGPATVAEAMLPLAEWHVLDYELCAMDASIAQVKATMEAADVRELVVMQRHGSRQLVRGVFTLDRIERCLGAAAADAARDAAVLPGIRPLELVATPPCLPAPVAATAATPAAEPGPSGPAQRVAGLFGAGAQAGMPRRGTMVERAVEMVARGAGALR